MELGWAVKGCKSYSTIRKPVILVKLKHVKQIRELGRRAVIGIMIVTRYQFYCGMWLTRIADEENKKWKNGWTPAKSLNDPNNKNFICLQITQNNDDIPIWNEWTGKYTGYGTGLRESEMSGYLLAKWEIQRAEQQFYGMTRRTPSGERYYYCPTACWMKFAIPARERSCGLLIAVTMIACAAVTVPYRTTLAGRAKETAHSWHPGSPSKLGRTAKRYSWKDRARAGKGCGPPPACFRRLEKWEYTDLKEVNLVTQINDGWIHEKKRSTGRSVSRECAGQGSDRKGLTATFLMGARKLLKNEWMKWKVGNIVVNIREDEKKYWWMWRIREMDQSKYRQGLSTRVYTKKRGWGLGLSLSKRIVSLYHKGEIFVKHSELGKGTTFRIVLKK